MGPLSHVRRLGVIHNRLYKYIDGNDIDRRRELDKSKVLKPRLIMVHKLYLSTVPIINTIY